MRFRRLNLQRQHPILHLTLHLYGLNYLRSLTRSFLFPVPLVAILHHFTPSLLIYSAESAGLTNTFTTTNRYPDILQIALTRSVRAIGH